MGIDDSLDFDSLVEVITVIHEKLAHWLLHKRIRTGRKRPCHLWGETTEELIIEIYGKGDEKG